MTGRGIQEIEFGEKLHIAVHGFEMPLFRDDGGEKTPSV